MADGELGCNNEQATGNGEQWQSLSEVQFRGQVPAEPEKSPKEREREAGIKILSKQGLIDRQREIVESSFHRARRAGQKLSGKNNDRRVDAYITRLEGMVERGGNTLEKRLWEKSTKKLLISPDDIPASYWESQEQILRDNGQGRTLSIYDKVELTADIRDKQEQSAGDWANYLGDENVRIRCGSRSTAGTG